MSHIIDDNNNDNNNIITLRTSSHYPAERIGAIVYADDNAIICDTIDQ